MTLAIFALSRYAAADEGAFSETLKQAESAALQNSGVIKAAKDGALAAQKQADASGAALYPNLSLQGNYFYQTNVPVLQVGPPGLGTPFQMGDYNNYAVGPVLTYTLFDGGGAGRLSESAQSMARAKLEDSKNTVKQILLNTRQAYAHVQLSIKNLTVTADSLRLSEARETDVRNRLRAGASSRLDSVNARSDVINYQLKLRQAQTDLAAAIRDLLALTGRPQTGNLSRPWPKEISAKIPVGVEAPTDFVQFDRLEESLKSQNTSPAPSNFDHPQLRSLSFAAESSKRAADAQMSVLWPKIQLSAHAEYMYPNGPILQSVQQNIFMVTMSMPLFEADYDRSLAQEHAREAEGYEYQREQRIIDLQRDRKKAGDMLDSLKSQERLTSENVLAAADAANLTYQSYKAGKEQYLDVETAHLKLLEAEVGAAQVQSDILNTLAQISFLSPEDEE